MKCQFHSSCRLNRFWGWCMVRISYPSFSKHRPCLVLDISLARDWQSARGSWKGDWQCPAEMLFQFWGWNQQPWEGLRTSVQSLVLKLAEAWMLTWVRTPASPRHPGKEGFMYKPCSCLGLGFEGWCNRCNIKGKVRNESTWCMIWHKLLLSYIFLLAFILVPHRTRSGISLLQSDLSGFLAAMLKLAGESVFSGI